MALDTCWVCEKYRPYEASRGLLPIWNVLPPEGRILLLKMFSLTCRANLLLTASGVS
jgi:hypothetical protein